MSDFPDQLLALDEATPFIALEQEVPGLHTFVLLMEPLATALGTSPDSEVAR